MVKMAEVFFHHGGTFSRVITLVPKERAASREDVRQFIEWLVADDPPPELNGRPIKGVTVGQVWERVVFLGIHPQPAPVPLPPGAISV